MGGLEDTLRCAIGGCAVLEPKAVSSGNIRLGRRGEASRKGRSGAVLLDRRLDDHLLVRGPIK
jgi:hypothetical protein